MTCEYCGQTDCQPEIQEWQDIYDPRNDSVRRWADAMIVEFPTVMAAVVDRPFGSLHSWLRRQPSGKITGCFVGTTVVLMNELLSCITIKPTAEDDENVFVLMEDFLAQCKRETLDGMDVQTFIDLMETAGYRVSAWAEEVEDIMRAADIEDSYSESQRWVTQQIKDYLRREIAIERSRRSPIPRRED